MKGAIFIIFNALITVSLTGCYTVPRHYSYQVEVIYYVPVDPPYPPEPIIDYPPPPPGPPIYNPPPTDTNPQRDKFPEKPKDSYGQRDPLQGGSNRGDGTINTLPPVRTTVQKDRDSQ
jgi:hypothetical protein